MAITRTFTTGNDDYSADADDTYILTFLAGADKLTTRRGLVSASMGDGDDLVLIRGGVVAANGDAGSDRMNFLADVAGVVLHGGTEDDTFFGYGHSIGGTIYGDAGNDSFYDFGNFGGRTVTLYGGIGDDIYRVQPTSLPTIVELAGEGTDTVEVATGASYTLAANLENITVVLQASIAGSAVLRGNAERNVITGGDSVETLHGLDGDDVVRGRGGDDFVWGGNGDDNLDGGDGNDELHGQAGTDILNGRSGDDTMIGGTGDDTYFVDSYGDVVIESDDGPASRDVVRTSLVSFQLPDYVEVGIIISSNGGLNGNGLDNDLYGGAGPDQIFGGAGNDTIRGGGDYDYLHGGLGNDVIRGDGGGDEIMGGAGADIFVYTQVSDSSQLTGMDEILDFSAGVDKINLTSIDADTTMSGNQAFSAVSSFTGHAGELVIRLPGEDDDYAVVLGDVDGDRRADITILLKYEYDVSVTDIFL